MKIKVKLILMETISLMVLAVILLVTSVVIASDEIDIRIEENLFSPILSSFTIILLILLLLLSYQHGLLSRII